MFGWRINSKHKKHVLAFILFLLLFGLVFFLYLFVRTGLYGGDIRTLFVSTISLLSITGVPRDSNITVVNQHPNFKVTLNPGVRTNSISEYFSLSPHQKIRVVITDQPQPLTQSVVRDGSQIEYGGFSADNVFNEDDDMLLVLQLNAQSITMLDIDEKGLAIVIEKNFYNAITESINRKSDIEQFGSLQNPEERLKKSSREAVVAQEYLRALNKGYLFMVERQR